MTTLERCLTRAHRVRDAIGESATVFLQDVGQGLLEVSHNMLALIGLLIVAATLFAFGRPELRQSIETEVLGLHRSKPSYSTFMSSSVAMLTPELPTLP